ncbi:MAG: hypothetical protein J0M00_13950 [Burkholderiales bacterium]|nr:hypothetical protein [Burkholderiales bacterium]
MSTDLYATALIWYGPRGGVAKLHGQRVVLRAAPELKGLRVEGIDYRPEIGERRIQLHAEGWRDMHQHEVAAADQYLAAVNYREPSDLAPGC